MSSVIFVHIQKTGGTTLRQILRRQYRSTCIVGLSLTHGALARELKNSDGDAKRVIQGHMVFGAHQFLDSDTRYLTMIRDPLDRVVSDYYYVLRTPTHDFHDPVATEDYSLEDYIRSEITIYTNNLQTRLLSGAGRSVPVGKCTESMLEQAKQNIEDHFDVVGLTDRFDESVVLMQRRLGWSVPKYAVRNKTSGRPYRETIPEGARTAVNEHNALDFRLYDFVSRRFEEALEDQDQDAFARDMKWLRYYNAVYAPSLRVYVKLREAYNWLVGKEEW